VHGVGRLLVDRFFYTETHILTEIVRRMGGGNSLASVRDWITAYSAATMGQTLTHYSFIASHYSGANRRQQVAYLSSVLFPLGVESLYEELVCKHSTHPVILAENNWATMYEITNILL